MNTDLRARTFSAIRWTTLGAVMKTCLNVGQVSVLARILAKEDYGLMAMVGVVVGLTGIFADFGVNSAFIQRQEITLNERSSLFWFNVLVGVSFTFLTCAISPICAIYFQEQRIVGLLFVVAPTFFLGSLLSQIKAAASKSLNFRSLVVLETGSTLVGFVSSLLLALNGWGTYSLALGTLVASLWAVIHGWWMLSNGWKPRFRCRLEEIRPFLGFGSAVMANNIVNYLNTSFDILVAGRFLSPAALGTYSVPRNLSLYVQRLFNPVITRIGFPLISKVQDDKNKVSSIYLRTIGLTTSINAPFYIAIYFYANEIVHILYGPAWGESASVLSILAIWGLIRSTSNPVGTLLLGVGRANVALYWNLVSLLIVPPAVYIGSSWGVQGVANALTMVQVGLFIPCWYFLVRPFSEINFLTYSKQIAVPVILAVIAFGVAYALTTKLTTPFIKVSVASAIAAVVYFAMSIKFNLAFVRSLKSLGPSKFSL